jgi:MFS family permease
MSLLFLAAFEELAIATVMPRIADDLHGHSVYSLGVAAPMATAIIGMVVSGAWSDRHGPRGPFWFGSTLFGAGLLVAGLAPEMTTFVVGRLLQGLGAGAINVTIYVLVARLYPMHLHAKIFGLFAACWVVPSLIGPFLAGAVAQALTWHWVFLGVLILAGAACATMMPSLKRLPDEDGMPDGASPDGADGTSAGAASGGVRKVVIDVARAAVTALAVLSIGFMSGLGVWRYLILAVVVAVILMLIRPLLPKGAFLLAIGLPTVIVLRGLLAAADFGAEAYLPLLFNKVYDMDLALSGLALTVSAITWAVASWAQGRFFDTWNDRALLTFAVGFVVAAIAGVAVSTMLHLPVWIIVVSWAVSGFGMGMAYPRMSTMVIRLSPRNKQGFNSAALNMSDSTGAALGVAGLGTLQHGATVGPLAAIFTVATLIAAFAWFAATRAGRGGTRDVGQNEAAI